MVRARRQKAMPLSRRYLESKAGLLVRRSGEKAALGMLRVDFQWEGNSMFL
jgi:hypothetical protein